MRNTLFCIATAFLILPLQACGALYYSAEPIEAWVVDAETNQPLEGVNVVANWELKGGLEGGNLVGQVMVIEAITDSKGRFYFPGWGPISNLLTFGHIRENGPQLLIFKSGYKYQRLINKVSAGARPGPSLKSDWDGKSIKLERFSGTQREYAEDFRFLNADLYMATSSSENGGEGGKCYWKKIPHMISAEYKQYQQFIASGVQGPSSLYTQLISGEAYYEKKGCGSAKQFLEGEVK